MLKEVFNYVEGAYSDRCLNSYESGNQFCYWSIFKDYKVIIFRGTDDWIDVKHDINIKVVNHQHEGFTIAWGFLKEEVTKWVDMSKLPILFTGHSLGGALATLAAQDTACRGKPCSCITFAAPKVFDKMGRDFYDNLPINHTRVELQFDRVPWVPFSLYPIGKQHLIRQWWWFAPIIFATHNHSCKTYRKYLDKNK